jgi:Bacteriocin-protection, YdeI or OmpD-Associated/Domain of unknown function (DUF1905)
MTRLRVGAEGYERPRISYMDRFSAILGGEDGERPTVALPFDAKQRYGKARAPVRGTINGTAFRTTVAVYSGVQLIGFNKQLREPAAVEIGDEVAIELERDDEPREVDVPPELKAALAGNSEAGAVFSGLSYTHRREYAQWIAEAQRPQTRERPGRTCGGDAAGRRATPLADLEPAQPFGLLLARLDPVDVRRAWPALAELHQGLHVAGRSLEHGLDGPVGAVQDPTSETAAGGLAFGAVAKEDALDATVHDDSAPDRVGHRITGHGS